MRMSLIPWLLSLIMMPAIAHADDIDFRLNDRVERSRLVLGIDFAMLQSSPDPLTGFGPSIGFRYGFSPRWAIQPGVTLAFHSGASGLGYLYTGFSGQLLFAARGSFQDHESTLAADGRPVVIARTAERPQRIAFGLAVEQLIIAGTIQNYSASGFTLAGIYEFTLANREVSASARYGTFIVSGHNFPAITLNFSTLFGL